jgi:hypothetical protein
MLRVTGDPDMVITMEPAEVHLKAGGTAKATVHAVRRNGFAGRIPLDVPNLPHGVIVMDTGLNGILLPEGEEKRTIFLSAEPWVEAQRQTIYAIGRTETRSPLPTAFASEPAVLIIDPPEGVARRSF